MSLREDPQCPIPMCCSVSTQENTDLYGRGARGVFSAGVARICFRMNQNRACKSQPKYRQFYSKWASGDVKIVCFARSTKVEIRISFDVELDVMNTTTVNGSTYPR